MRQTINQQFLIGSLMFGLCLFCSGLAAKAAGFSLAATSSSIAVTAGQSVNCQIKIKRTGYTDKIVLSLAGPPSGVTAAFNPNNTTGNSTIMTVSVSAAAPAGVYQLKINGLEVVTGLNATPLFVTLTVHPAPSVRLSATPSSRSIFAGSQATYEIIPERTNYTGSVSLGVTNLPPMASATIQTISNKLIVRIQTSFGMGNSLTNFTVSGTADGAAVTPVSLRLRTNCNFQWSRQFSSAGFEDGAYNVTTDWFGNVIIVGYGEEYVPNYISRDKRALVAKYYSDGTLAWSRTLDSDEPLADDIAYEVITDQAGNVYLAGLTDGVMESGLPGGQNPNLSLRNWWLAKLDANGLYYWVRQGQQTIHSPFNVKLALDSAQNVILYTSGSFGRNFNTEVFDANGQSRRRTSLNLNDASADFVVAGDSVYTVGTRQLSFPDSVNGRVQKYDLAGSLIWERTFRVAEKDTSASKIAVDSAGNVFVGGRTEENGDDKFSWLRKLNGNGQFLWEHRLPIEDEKIIAFKVHTDGNLIVTGQNIKFDDAVHYQTWLSKFRSSDGLQQWIRKAESDGGNIPFNLHSDSIGNIYLAGGGTGVAAPFYGGFNMGEAWVIKYSDPAVTNLPANFFVINPSAAPGDVVSLRGVNLLSTEEILLEGVPANFTVISATEIRMTVPAISPGSRVITLRAGCESVRGEIPLTIF